MLIVRQEEVRRSSKRRKARIVGVGRGRRGGGVGVTGRKTEERKVRRTWSESEGEEEC